MQAPNYLDQASAAMRDRAAQRDCPDGERSMRRTVAIFKAYTDIELTEKQGWQFMMCLKMARGAQGEHCDDDYIDGCAYTALAAESSLIESIDDSTYLLEEGEEVLTQKQTVSLPEFLNSTTGVEVSAPETKDLNAGRRHPMSTGN